MPKVGWIIIALAALLAVLGVIVLRRGSLNSGFCWDCAIGTDHPQTVRPNPLKVLAAVQADFRANDRDGNGIQDYWRSDVAGLYAAQGRDGKPLGLIDLALAQADAAPARAYGLPGKPAPISRYWLRAIQKAEEKNPSPQHFAFCAFPQEYPRHGRLTYIIDDQNTIFQKDLGGNAVEVFPEDPLKEGWSFWN